MIRNFFRVTIRNIARNKVFTFLNIAGLAIGMSASLLILLWVQDELSYDRFHSNAENIYRVEMNQNYSGDVYHVYVTPQPSGPVWKERIPEIVEQTRVRRLSRTLFRHDDNVFFENSLMAVDSGFFSVFSFPLVSGDPSDVLSSPNSIVLTEELAGKYFGDTNPVGQTLSLDNRYLFTVTGVIKDLPHNSLFTFDALLPYAFLQQQGAIRNSWGENSIFTFVLVNKGTDIENVNGKVTDVVREYLPESLNEYMLFPLTEIHLHQQFGFTHTNGPVTVIWIFAAVALFVLLIACINFINLSTAKAGTRAREISIKKVTGAARKTLIIQFMLESMLMVAFSMILSLLIVGLLLDLFNNITGKEFILSDLLKTKLIAGFLATGVITAIVSGIYPAFYMASLKPVAILKGDAMQGKGNGRLRQALVVMQFTLSILIAMSAVFLYRQLNYMREKDLGYDKENLIAIPMPDDMRGRYYSLKSRLSFDPLILGVTGSLRNPVMIGSNSGGARWEGKDPEKQVLIGVNAVDYDYTATMKMQLVSGRDFSREFAGDMARDTTGNFLVNEEVAKIIGQGDPVGKGFRFMGLNGTIVGVLKNFHFKGADQAIEPMAFALADTTFLGTILIRLTPGRTHESLNVVESAWGEIIPEYPLQYTFISQDYNDLFRSQKRLTELLKYFTILALIIASFGLYGLSSYSAERRTNEIGVRKVMGASSMAVVVTMVKEFLWLVLISLVIALPSGWLIVNNLLKQFPYRVKADILVFVVIAAGAILLASVTISFHTYRSTRINPAEALKIE
jgi:ABC-type antimicrobial peptide transport system permease subunit